MATVIAYVDGFNLYHGLHDKYRRRYLWLDLEHLVRRLRPSDHIVAFEIRSLIPGAFTVGAADLRNSLLPDTVTDAVSGRVHKRPGKWR